MMPTHIFKRNFAPVWLVSEYLVHRVLRLEVCRDFFVLSQYSAPYSNLYPELSVKLPVHRWRDRTAAQRAVELLSEYCLQIIRVVDVGLHLVEYRFQVRA